MPLIAAQTQTPPKESVENSRQVAKEAEEATTNIGEQNIGGLVEQIKTSSEQINTELTAIRAKIEETFDFSKLNPNYEGIKTITDNIYLYFVQLQGKIKSLDWSIGKINGIEVAESSSVLKTLRALSNPKSGIERAYLLNSMTKLLLQKTIIDTSF